MRPVEEPFEIEFDGNLIGIREHQIADRRVFYIDFKGRRKALAITVGLNRKDEKFWTSVPEGRQDEAEIIGRLIAQYIRSKN